MIKIVPKISEEGKKRKEQVEVLEKAYYDAQIALSTFNGKCPHEFRELTNKEIKDKWMSEGAQCLICEGGFGWRCKKSPDSVCHYSSQDGKVELLDGTKVDVPEGHDPKYESDDGCIFCGMPDERK